MCTRKKPLCARYYLLAAISYCHSRLRPVFAASITTALVAIASAIILLLHTDTAQAWRVNAFLTDQGGFPDAHSAASVGCALDSGKTRIIYTNFMSGAGSAAAHIGCESYDATTAEWTWWREAFIAAEPGDLNFFMDAGIPETEGQGNSCPSSKNPINLISGNKYKVYTDIESDIGSGLNRPGFIRYYNSQSAEKNSTIGMNWTHSYDRRMLRMDAIKTRAHLETSTDGTEPSDHQSSVYTTRQDACETGIADVRSQAQGLAAGPYRNLKAFLEAEARWENDQCRIYVDGRFRAVFPIFLHSGSSDGGNRWDHLLRFYRPDGQVVSFQRNPGSRPQSAVVTWEELTREGFWLEETDVTPAPVPGEVVVYQAHYTLTDPDNIRETYDGSGRLLYVEYPNGVRETLSYQDSMVVRVANSLGQYLDIGYDVDGYIESVTDELNRVWGYRYLDNNLVEVIKPDLSTVNYHYEDADFPGALTGVTDERRVRVSVFEYHPDGLTKSSYLGQPGALPELQIENVDVAYGAGSNTVTNSRGFQSTYHFSEGVLTRFDGPECDSCPAGSKQYSFDPDTRHLISSIEYGQTTLFEEHDHYGHPGVVTEAATTSEQRTATYTYDPRFVGKVATKTEPSVFASGSKVTTHTYDDSGNTTSITIEGYRPDGTTVSQSQTFAYNGPYHQLSEIDGPRSDVDDRFTMDYYPDALNQGNNRARMQRLAAPTDVVLYDGIQYTATGKVASYSTGSSLRVDFSYYAGSDQLETQTLTDLSSGEVRATRWTYTASGETESVTQGYATPDSTTLRFEYDNARRLTRIYDSFDNYIDYVLDTEGNVVNEAIYDNGGTLLKNLVRSFDAYNRFDISKQVNETRNMDFLPDGTLKRETNGRSVVTDYSYDALRRLTSVAQDVGGTDPASADALTRLDYNIHDKLTAVTDPNGGETRYTYDDLGNLLSTVSPDAGVSVYTHDAAGNISSKTDAKVQEFNYSYDALGRITLVDAPGTSDDISYGYDTCENGAGRLCTVSRDGTTISYSYTAFGEIKSGTQAVETFPPYEQAIAQVSYTYDATGRIRDMVYPGGDKYTYTYDKAGNVYSVIMNDGERNLVTDSQYYPFGPESRVTRGNGSSVFRSLDHAYRAWITGQGGYFFDVIYYDAGGNPAAFFSWDGIETHTYDALDRLKTSSGPYGTRDYSYDRNGNRSSKTSDSVTDSYSYETNSNRMTSDAGRTVLLDANGNTTSIRGLTIDYTPDNRVENIRGKASYLYNGLGERVMKAVAAPGTAGSYGYTQKTVYVYGRNGKLLAEMSSSGRVKQEYIYMNEELLATVIHAPREGEPILNADMDSDGAVGIDDFLIWYFNHYIADDVSRDVDGDSQLTVGDLKMVLNCAMTGSAAASCATSGYTKSIYFAHNDHLGTPQMLSDENGAAVWSAVYDPFGRTEVNEDLDADGNHVTLNIRFPGQFYDAESGLHYNYFRSFDPVFGRYVTSDPIGLIAGLNTYEYVDGNPYRWIDPFGLQRVAGAYGYGIRNAYYYGGMKLLFTEVPKKFADCVYCVIKKQVLGYLPSYIRDEVVGYALGDVAKAAVKKVMLPVGIATSYTECVGEMNSINAY